MARIELSNIGGGGGTTLSLTTTGTSGASTLTGSVLNIPVYQGQLTLTTTGTSGAATLSGDILNIPQYSGGGGTPAGSTGEIQYNNAGAFGASADLAWDNSAVQLNIGAPSSPTGKLNVRGGGTTSGTVNLRLTDSGNTELLKVLDNGSVNIGTGFNWDNVNSRLGLGGSPAAVPLTVFGSIHTDGIIQRTQTATNFSFSGGSCIITASGTVGVRVGSNGTFIGGTSVLPSAGQNCVIRGRTSATGASALIIQNSATTVLNKIDNDGKISYLATNTAAGTTGPQTINQPSGTVNFGIGASALVVTNSLCTANSIVFATVRTNDATAYIKNVVPAALGGSFTINLGAAATAETSVGFFIIN